LTGVETSSSLESDSGGALMSSLDSLFAVGDIWTGQEAAAAAAIGEVRLPFITRSRVGPMWFLYVRAIEAWAALRLEYFILERRTFLPKNCQICSGSLSRTARLRCYGLPRPVLWSRVFLRPKSWKYEYRAKSIFGFKGLFYGLFAIVCKKSIFAENFGKVNSV
jgi:hypothetical protein